MGVLPDRSKSIVPTPYHDLMTNPDSPIIDFYPRDFELDMNGKKMEWEAVVKIPFIDEYRLLKAMKTKDHLLTHDENTRNDFGVSLKFTYSADLDFTYPSSLVGVFPDISHCHCVENIFDLPIMEGLHVRVGLIEGVKLGESALAGFPSLQTLPFYGALGFHGVSVFQQDSRNESMVITLLDSDIRTKVESAKKQLGQRVYVGFPFLSEAKVVKVSDELFDYIPPPDNEGGPAIAVPHGPYEIDTWRRKSEKIGSNYSKRLGMVIGHVDSLVHVHILKGLSKTDDGATVKEYALIPGIETDYASQTVVSEVISEDQRFLEKAALPIEQEYPEGTRAFFLGEFNYGRPLEVIKHVDNKADIWISIVKGKEVEFGRDVVKNVERDTPYTPSFAVARMLHLNPLVLSKITSAFQVTLDEGKVNLGLNLKFEAKKLKVLGFSRRGATGWEFSEAAIRLLQQYMLKFPEFIAAIQRNPQGNIFTAADLYPGEESKKKIKDIQAWLKVVESKNFEKVPLEAEQLDSEAVKKIELAANNAVKGGPPIEGKKIKGVPRNALLKPSDAEHRLGNQRFELGDRIVYVQDSGRVPIASRGTVVGLTRTSRTTLLDIVFDVTFMSGTSLGDRCSPFRGSTVPISSVLNITNRQIVAGSRAAEDHRPQTVSQPLDANRYGAPLGPNGRGQLIPAKPPAPLRGSFRGAIAGQSNGFRANGMARGRENSNDITNRSRGSTGIHRNSYTPIDQGDSKPEVIKNNPDFRPQSYTNVPPPATLDTRGRGRGGRGSTARGDGFRGRGFNRGRGILTAQQQ